MRLGQNNLVIFNFLIFSSHQNIIKLYLEREKIRKKNNGIRKRQIMV